MQKPVKINFKTEIFPIALIAITFVLSFYFYKNFPDQVPTHWNFAGEVDGYSSPASAAFFVPGLLLFLYFMFLFLPQIDPKKEKYEQFQKVYHIFRALIMLFLAVAYVLAGFSALGANLPIGKIIPAMVGILFVIMGNYMGKIKSNWFVGIKNPWTLSSENVWNKTHRLSGKLFMLAGVLIAITPYLPSNLRLPIFLVAIFGFVFGTFGYSYWLYRQEK